MTYFILLYLPIFDFNYNMRLGTSPTTTITVPGNGGHLGSSQSIADTQYSATNHPFLKGNESVYNINNPKLGMLQNFVP